jgi:hypothetical protein
MPFEHPPEPNDPTIYASAHSGCYECLEALIERHMGD